MVLDIVLSTAICIGLLYQSTIEGLTDPVEQAGGSTLLLAVTSCLVWPFTFQQLDVYSSVRTIGTWDVMRRLLVSACVVATVLGAVAFAADIPISREFPIV